MTQEKQNAAQFPRVFYCRHMQPGIVKYENETILVDTDGVKHMMPSGVGKPVYIHHQKVDLDTMKEKAAGYVTDSFYNELDGWAWFKFLAIDDDCYHAISEGWAVSNAYVPTEWGEGGTKNNCPYEREVKNGEFTHLAVVPDPRYEGACIMTPEEFKIYQDSQKRKLEELQNSNQSKGKTMLKLFKNTKQEVASIDADTMIELENGKSVSIEEMINAVCKKNAEEKKEKENGDQMVDVDGEKMPLKELVNKYKKMNEKKNESQDEEEEEDEPKKEKKNRQKKNDGEDDDDDGRTKKEKSKSDKGHDDQIEKDLEEDEEKENSHFDELRNAHLKHGTDVVVLETSMDKLARGRALFTK